MYASRVRSGHERVEFTILRGGEQQSTDPGPQKSGFRLIRGTSKGDPAGDSSEGQRCLGKVVVFSGQHPLVARRWGDGQTYQEISWLGGSSQGAPLQKGAGGVGGSLCPEVGLWEENHQKWRTIKSGIS